MMERGWGRVVNITSQSVKAPIAVLGLSNSARAGLTGYVAGTARQVAGSGVAINNLLPGIHATDRAIVAMDRHVSEEQGITDRGGQGAALCQPAGGALWHGGGVWRGLCLHVLAACRVHRSGRTSCWMAAA